MDRITANLLSEFSSEYGYDSLSEVDRFEHFVSYAVVSQEYTESFDPGDVYLGDDTPGIDGVAILVNGALVTDEEEVADLVDTNHYLEVAYIFTQAKTGTAFEGSEIGSFIEAVRDFFRERPRQVRTPRLQQLAKVSDSILRQTSRMRTNPRCALFFVTTGRWQGDAHLQARLDQGREDLEKTGMFSEVVVRAYGAAELQRWYRQSRETVSVEIEFPNKVTLPDVPGIEQAYIGTLPVSTLFQLITDDIGNIRKAVFEDNIRDFQGDTRVNQGIRQTLKSPKHASTFAVLNNGITIVCRELKVTGNRCAVASYQIVNGCQTSHVLYECRKEFEPDQVLIPVKLVSTQDEEIVNAIIRSTNSQNAVKPEELEAMTEFQKPLEAYYRTFSGMGILYYERRSKQWVASKVEKTRIVTIPNQIKSLASMFLDQPHRGYGYYGTVRQRIGDRIFKPDHREAPYYTSTLALYRLDTLFRSRHLDTKYKQLRWYLLMLLRQCSGAGRAPALNSKSIDSYCEPLIHLLLDGEKSTEAYLNIIERIEETGLPFTNRDTLKTQAYRDNLLNALGLAGAA